MLALVARHGSPLAFFARLEPAGAE